MYDGIVKDQKMLYHFISYLKEQGAIQLLQSSLTLCQFIIVFLVYTSSTVLIISVNIPLCAYYGYFVIAVAIDDVISLDTIIEKMSSVEDMENNQAMQLLDEVCVGILCVCVFECTCMCMCV